ncbi:hypothetical protein Pint_16518 [Pistacia integerrima]|uniref:Uncharacterized protein n=1 Tax=Pistacia integerrima TaxID=434235 RepID=A0ACC0Z9A9_9ROSI|nr:hypothetical protein Pint_16518 [Pistacia integerrima]
MNNNLFPPLVLHYMIFTLFFILIAIPSSYCDDELYGACRNPFPCCGLNLSYPFWGGERRPECGKYEFKITCEEDLPPIMEIQSQRFHVLGINTTDQTVTIRKDPPWNGTSCPERSTVSISFNRFLSNYSSNVRNLSLFYSCTEESLSGSNNYTCQQGDKDREGFYTIDDEPKYFPNHTDTVTCIEVTKVPILLTALDKINYFENLERLRELLAMGLEVKYEAENGLCSACQSSRGTCGSTNAGEFVCFCRDKPYRHACAGMHALPTLCLTDISFRCIYSNFALV